MSKQYRRLLVVLSGGQDSTTCLYWAKLLADEVLAVTFDYNQRHAIEVGAAAHVAALAGVAHHEVVAVGDVLRGTSPLVNSTRDVERYADAASLPGGIEKTFVPMRNALFIVLAMNRAVVEGCNGIVLGVSEEDYGGYPDCRERFILQMELACKAAIGESAAHPAILTPLLHLDKRETVELAARLPGCMEALAYSHTCYNGEVPPCGTCHACLLRAKGFEQAGLDDPLIKRLVEQGKLTGYPSREA